MLRCYKELIYNNVVINLMGEGECSGVVKSLLEIVLVRNLSESSFRRKRDVLGDPSIGGVAVVKSVLL